VLVCFLWSGVSQGWFKFCNNVHDHMKTVSHISQDSASKLFENVHARQAFSGTLEGGGPAVSSSGELDHE